jgi:MFS transporter, PPP family, 3-phenylpropionic acid transporter
MTVISRRTSPSRELLHLRVVYTAIGLGVGSLLPFLVLYLTWRGLTATEAGLVVGLMSAVGVVAVPAWGLLADRALGVAGALRLSFVLAAGGALVLLAAGGSLPLVALSAAALAGVRAPGEALADTLTVVTLREEATRFYGSVRLWSSIGYALAVAIGGLVLSRTSLALVLVIYPAAMLVGAVTVGAVRGRSHRPRTASTAVPGTDRLLDLWRRFGGPFLWVLAGALVLGIGMGASSTVLPLRITDVGGGVAMVGAASVVGAVGEVPLMMSSHSLRRRWGARPVLLLGGGLFAVAVLMYGVLGAAPGIVAVCAVRGAGYALVYVGFVITVGTLLPSGLQARGQALLQTTLAGIAPVAGASLGGYAFAHIAPTLLFASCGALLLVGTGLACKGAHPAERARRPKR